MSRATVLGPLAIAALGLGLCAAAGCGRDEPASVRRDALHDLIADAMHAEVSGPGSHGARPDLRVDDADNRDAMAFVRCPTGQSVRFPPLAVVGPAEASFTCGTSLPPGSGHDARPVRFRLEAARAAPGADVTDADFRVVAERTLSLDELSAASALAIEHAALPGEGAAEWTLRFSTQRMPGPGETADAAGGPEWPAFVAPLLRSEGRLVALADDPILVPDIAHDLRAELPSATIVQSAPDAPVAAGAFDPTDGASTESGGTRPVIAAHAPARIRYSITPDAGATLHFSVGVDSQAGWTQGGSGLVFAVEIDGQRVWERTMNPFALRRDRTWKPAMIDLSPWVGRTVPLELVTEPVSAADSRFEAGGWALPAIVQPRRTERLPARDAPTIVLVVVDTLRADRLGCCGGPAGQTPRIDALAAAGVSFRAAHSTASWTWPATASILTGRAPNEHGVHDARRCLLREDLDTLAELAQRRGYTTGAFIANMLIASDNRFDQGFETFVVTPNATARALDDRVAHWLDQTEGAARFLYVHYIDPHAPYAPPPAFLPAGRADAAGGADDEALLAGLLKQVAAGEAPDPAQVQRYVGTLSARYDGEVRYIDTAIGELLDALERHGALQDALVVVTADHGEEFLEHGNVGHGPTLYEETLAVPLVMTGFGRLALAPDVRHEVVTTRDIAPTIVALTGLPAPGRPFPGRSLLAARPSAAPGSLAGAPLFAETFLGRDASSQAVFARFSILADGWKLVHTPATHQVELYDLRTDPGEHHDRGGEPGKRREALLSALEAASAGADAADPNMSPEDEDEAVRRLEQMGYIGGK